jgi:hypothetical protein
MTDKQARAAIEARLKANESYWKSSLPREEQQRLAAEEAAKTTKGKGK